MTTYTLRKGTPDKTRTDVVVIAMATSGEDKEHADLEVCPGGEAVASAYGRRFGALLQSMGFGAAPGEVVRFPTAGTIKAAQLVVVGMGPRDALTTEKVRRAAGVAARNVGNAASVALALPAIDAAHIRAVADGFLAGSYTFTAYKTAKQASPVADVVILSDAARRADAAAALEAAQAVGEAMGLARDWVNTPPNDLVPEMFADAVVAQAKKRKGLTITRYDAATLASMNCGGILGVGQGSAHPPCLLTLTWAPPNATTSIAIIGKGITFDSGGYSIKPAAGMTTMKCDMGGAAAVAATLQAVADLNLPIKVTGYLAMAENMVSGSAIRPGDVLTMRNGKTVEIRNTDAEGRLVMADALALAAEEKPDLILDIATLTGPCVIALGERIAGIFGDDEPVAQLEAAAERSGELLWRLPIPEAIAEKVRKDSPIADVLQHDFVRFGSASFAAAFLREFTDGLPWGHLDIAGPAYNTGAAWGHVPRGATGFGVPTLVEVAAMLAEGAGTDETAPNAD